MAKVAVTGAAGFIGAYLTIALAEAGHEVLALDNYARGRPARLAKAPDNVETITCDVRDREALEQHLAGVDTMFHLAAINGTENFYKQPQLVLDVGVRGALAVAEACNAVGVRTLIAASSAEVYQTPPEVPTDEDVPLILPNSLNPRYSYGGSKIVTELIAFNYCRETIAQVQCFRPHNVYGPDMGWKHVIPQLIAKITAASAGDGVVELQGDGTETRAFCYVDDIVAGIIAMWERGETMNVYHIGSMEEVAIRDLTERVAAAMGADVSFRTGEAPAGATPRRCPDIAKMRGLGYEPKVPLAEGIARTVAWYRDNPEPVGGNELL
ncbi:NAD-dependent epimerase/dehydratase family protein [Aurantiacibacter aquimixticola]|uniref:SDR family NAD(P)-dependent oxidoreductase n=1 Tax=Aurantiacibacter aquimixticola TaxID=1958945 RepID=A0A419RUJ5_9SPHN|nr:NAD-dependent epimerase/dehydratase family protein [Aurantiacibacter aquimixticola]RJY09467.1 SDR family NAD(P)-dependent oxidoreductase [Aurantiacibacter aquimixticola]